MSRQRLSFLMNLSFNIWLPIEVSGDFIETLYKGFRFSTLGDGSQVMAIDRVKWDIEGNVCLNFVVHRAQEKKNETANV